MKKDSINTKKKQNEEVITKPDSVEITLPENLTAYLTPMIIILQTIILSVILIVIGNNIGKSLKIADNGTNTATTAGATTAAAKQLTQSDIKNAFNSATVKMGKDSAKLVLVEVSDPSCPYCHIAAGKNSTLNNQDSRFKLVADGGTYVAPVVEFKKLLDEGKASYAYLYSYGHGNGEVAATALYCGNEMGKFWEVHDRLMSAEGYTFLNETQKSYMTYNITATKTSQGMVEVTDDDLTKMAEFLQGVADYETMKSCLLSKKYADAVDSDAAVANSLGIQGTPGFLVNTKLFAGAYSYTDMESTVEDALK